MYWLDISEECDGTLATWYLVGHFDELEQYTEGCPLRPGELLHCEELEPKAP